MAITKYALTKRGGSPYIGSSWTRAKLSPSLYDDIKEANLVAEKLTEVNPVGFYVMEIKYNLSQEQIDTIMKMPFPENWYELGEHFAGHRILL